MLFYLVSLKIENLIFFALRKLVLISQKLTYIPENLLQIRARFKNYLSVIEFQ